MGCRWNGRWEGVGEGALALGMVCVGIVSVGESVGQEVGDLERLSEHLRWAEAVPFPPGKSWARTCTPRFAASRVLNDKSLPRIDTLAWVTRLLLRPFLVNIFSLPLFLFSQQLRVWEYLDFALVIYSQARPSFLSLGCIARLGWLSWPPRVASITKSYITWALDASVRVSGSHRGLRVAGVRVCITTTCASTRVCQGQRGVVEA